MTEEPSAPQTLHNEGPSSRHLAPTGDITIFEAAEFRESLVNLFANDGLVSLDLSGTARVDSAAIQLLLTAKKQNRMFVSGISQELQTKLTQLGFTDSLSE